jgi:hypothetical protein
VGFPNEFQPHLEIPRVVQFSADSFLFADRYLFLAFLFFPSRQPCWVWRGWKTHIIILFIH